MVRRPRDCIQVNHGRAGAIEFVLRGWAHSSAFVWTKSRATWIYSMDTLDIYYGDSFSSQTPEEYPQNPPACRYSRNSEQVPLPLSAYAPFEDRGKGDLVPYDLPPCQHNFPEQTHTHGYLAEKERAVDEYQQIPRQDQPTEPGGQFAYPWMRTSRSHPHHSPVQGELTVSLILNIQSVTM